MSFSVKLNKSNNISFRVNPSSSSVGFTLTLPRITLSLRVKRRKKSISNSYGAGASYKPADSVDISSLQTEKYKTYISKILRLISLNHLSNFLIPSLLLSLLPKLIGELLGSKGRIHSVLNKSLICFGFSISLSVIITFFFLLIGVIGIILKIYVHSIGRVQYDFSNDKLPSIWTKELIISSEDISYAETEELAADVSVLEQRWKYVNKDGSKDKRYKDNKKIYVCNYRLISVENELGFKLLLLSCATNIL